MMKKKFNVYWGQDIQMLENQTYFVFANLEMQRKEDWSTEKLERQILMVVWKNKQFFQDTVRNLKSSSKSKGERSIWKWRANDSGEGQEISKGMQIRN